MKKCSLFQLRMFVSVVLSFVMAVSFAGCSDDDNGSDGGDLIKVVVGTWVQDGDNDILTLNADGTGVGYDNPSDYQNGRVGYSLNWSYSNGWVTVIIPSFDQIEKLRAKSVSQNKIVWQQYAVETDDYDPSDDDWDGHDAFGYYDIWTWERYK